MATADLWMAEVSKFFLKHPITDIVWSTRGLAGDDFWNSLTPVDIPVRVARYKWQMTKA
jgi:hypothetical protein